MTSLSLPIHLPPPNLDGKGLRIGIVVARYNWTVTGAMLALAYDELLRLNVDPQQIQVHSVPGSFELATLARGMLVSARYDALLCLGCVMKGATRHDVVVSDAAAQGIQRVALDSGTPIIFGVICAENQQQAEERIERATECARAAVEMARSLQCLHANAQAS
ncbi:MAG: 6,7-dimethyl-8-ribityllumazine synthase [Ktedonobacteraceae bacterium]|nr:6,7-dimethyl-8-ribityllumazine synthase [Ktedonobacteraceae bacterium]